MNEERPSLLDHLRRALEHAEGAIRCYLALVLARLQERRGALLRSIAWAALLVTLAVLGVVFVLSGLAQLIESHLGVPGGGRICVGGGILILLGVLALVRGRRKGD